MKTKNIDMKKKENNQNIGCVIGLLGLLILIVYFIYFIGFNRAASFWPFVISFICLLIGIISSQSISNDDEKKILKKGELIKRNSCFQANIYMV